MLNYAKAELYRNFNRVYFGDIHLALQFLPY